MSKTLSYGYKKPENGDTGDSFFQDVVDNATRLNDHSHDGTDSARLVAGTGTISSGSWSADAGNNTFSQNVTLPTGFAYDTTTIDIRLANGEKVYAKIEKVSSTVYTVYTNDDTQSYVAVYTT